MTSRMFVSSSSNLIRRGMFSPCVSRHRLTHPRSMVTAVRRLVASAHSRRSPPSSAVGVRCLSSSTTPEEPEEPRESMAFDVLVVGGGPAGLASAIRLKQLCAETGKDLSVCLIDKGRSVACVYFVLRFQILLNAVVEFCVRISSFCWMTFFPYLLFHKLTQYTTYFFLMIH